MKKLFLYKSVIFILLCFNACDKNIEITEIQPTEKLSLDENGGSWKTYVLTSTNEITLPAPSDAGSSAYQAELQQLKNIQAGLTKEQREAVRYWGSGAILRWHEIARELAANYNLPPKANADGTYPVPNAASPCDLPRFPFANPPYTSRTLAYLAVAQYDALVAAWHYKFQFNRKAPYQNDPSVSNLLPVNNLPSYPSEDAVVAAASREILKTMFPCEAENIAAKALEQQNSRLWAGANVQSDVDAGENLGKLVAQKVLDRARTDGMGGANNQNAVPGLIQSAINRGIPQPWQSLESPTRPPLLPLFGNVRTWNFGEAEVIALRPAPPPVIGSEEFNTDLEELRKYSKKLTREQHRIANFWADGPGSYTPPGHWNRIAAELIYTYRLSELRAARAMALVNTTLMDAGVCCWDVKYYYFFPRPNQIDPEIKSVVGVPNFPAYTSGHSTFSAAAARVLGYIFPSESEALWAKAVEASESRIYGCIHYRFDCKIGLICGENIAAYAIQKGKSDGSPQ